MHFRYFPFFVLVALVACLHQAVAQTARIAHLSHGGSAETWEVAADNFGELAPVFEVDSIRFLSDTTTLEYGSWQGRHNTRTDKTTTYQFNSRLWGDNHVSAKSYVEQSRRYRPQIKIVGYDTLPPAPKPAPVLKKQKTKRKKAAFLPPAPAPPRHPGAGLVVVTLLVCAGAGWLLGGRRPARQTELTA